MATSRTPDTAKMVVFAADEDVGVTALRAIASGFAGTWKPGDFDVVLIGAKAGSGPRAAEKIKAALKADA